MTRHFHDFHSVLPRLVPDFSLLKVPAHKADPRAAACVVIAGMTLGLLLMLTWSLGEPVRWAAASKSPARVAPPPAADKVTIVAATPRLDVPCAEQTWPYIDRRCLSETTQKRPLPAGALPPEAPAALDARNATAAVVPAPAPAPPPAAQTQPAPSVAPTAREPLPQPDIAMREREPAATNAMAVPGEWDDDVEGLPVISPRELRRMERAERRERRRAERRKMRHWQVTIFPRIF
jgi:hypothetical protein